MHMLKNMDSPPMMYLSVIGKFRHIFLQKEFILASRKDAACNPIDPFVNYSLAVEFS
jgi:hypothetical protein